MTPVSLIAIGQLTFYHQKMQQEEDEEAAADADGELRDALQMSGSAHQQRQQQLYDVESQMVPAAAANAEAPANGGYGSKDAAATPAAAPAAAALPHTGSANKPTLDNLKSLKQ
jgi:hypothetical protein